MKIPYNGTTFDLLHGGENSSTTVLILVLKNTDYPS